MTTRSKRETPCYAHPWSDRVELRHDGIRTTKLGNGSWTASMKEISEEENLTEREALLSLAQTLRDLSDKIRDVVSDKGL